MPRTVLRDAMTRRLQGMRAIASSYDDFLVDLWGVIHNGERAFDGVLPALEALADAGRRVLFVTNSSRLGELVVVHLVDQLGIGRALFHDVVSSGDVTRAALLARDPELFRSLPATPRVFHLGSASFVPWLFEMDFAFVDDVDDADFIVATGTFRDARALEEARSLLAYAAARGVPLVCTNPDRILPHATREVLGPGAIAHVHAEAGARVFLYGKPHAPIYAEAWRRLGGDPGRRVVAIGDLVDTDIRGARGAGLDSVLVGPTNGGAEDVAPDMRIDRFVW